MWYLTKYALTTGIVEIEDGFCSPSSLDGYISIKRDCDFSMWSARIGSDIHNNKQDAIARANDMRDKRIASVKKQLLKLEKMIFA